MDDGKRINGTHLLLAFIAGAAAGAAIALLTAPRSGAATRQWLRDLGVGAGHDAQARYGRARDAVSRAFHRERPN
jgi:gas vesicle protein